MDGENNVSKPYEQMDELGWFSPIFGNTHVLEIGKDMGINYTPLHTVSL